MNIGNENYERIVLKSFAALALVPEENIFLGFEKLKESTAKMQNEKLQGY